MLAKVAILKPVQALASQIIINFSPNLFIII